MASSPLLASAATVMSPSASKIMRKPRRSSGWSSVSKTEMLIWVARSRGDLFWAEGRLDQPASVGGGSGVQGAVVQGHPFTHAGQAVALAGRSEERRHWKIVG